MPVDSSLPSAAARVRAPLASLAIAAAAFAGVALLVPAATRGDGGGDAAHAGAGAAAPALDPARVPFEAQAPDFCGEACLSMALRYWGVETDQYRVHALTGVAPELGRGAWTAEMNAATRRLWGPSYPSPWFELTGKEGEVETRFRQLASSVASGTPCMVCCRYDERKEASEHFRLVTRIDPATGELTYQEPAEADGAGRRMTKERFVGLWPVRGSNGPLLILFPFPAPPAAARAAIPRLPDLAGRVVQAVRRVRARVPADFHLGVEGPFVIASDQSPEEFRSSRQHTIQWAYTHLQAQFFPGGLRHPIEVYLLNGKASYEGHVEEWFHERPHTKYGYYSPAHQALFMNIATGGGTLVHEMVHPLMAEQFPGVPSWFNEGLASLFEQCGEENGKMVGLLNWRYSGLMEAIRTGQFKALERLMRTDSQTFYANDQGDNYGIARYLCQYLQSRGKIQEYYQHFHAHSGEDPTGIASLRAVLGGDSMEKIQADWLAWLKTLKR
ncbi:MAG: C39 family peptidase [Planctomycetes bacterium]|nr:C39 family peptidase [Planctomycetota bacterium]